MDLILDRLIQALAAQLQQPGAMLTPGAREALSALSRDEARLFFGQAGHLVHYGSDGEAVNELIGVITGLQRDEAPADAVLRPGDVVRLAGRPSAGLSAYDAAAPTDTWYVIRYVGDDGTADVQPELTYDYVVEVVPLASLETLEAREP